MTKTMESTTKATILIVDDTPGNLAVLSDLLSEAHYRVLVATDGLTAIEQLTLVKPDIILLDVMMPGIDGFETCHRIKQTPETSNLPIIFMTGLSELDDLLRAFEQGAIDYIVKPIRPAEVLARIEAQLKQAKNLQCAETSLNYLCFAALAFDPKGIITWLTPTAIKILIDCFPDQYCSACKIQNGDYLPPFLINQLKHIEKDKQSNVSDTALELKINPSYAGKIVSIEGNTEKILLIHQQKDDQWNQKSLKNNFGLTAREAEILMWISRGKTNKEVGLILETSPRTVNKHLEHIFEKLGVPTRTAAVAKVLNN